MRVSNIKIIEDDIDIEEEDHPAKGERILFID
jgi:hypothetical protein